MPETFDIRSTLICEDFREEASKKQILISVYAGTMLVDSVPFFLPSFVIRIEIVPRKKSYKMVQVSISDPEGKQIAKNEGSAEVEIEGIPVAITVKWMPCVFEKEGIYKILLGMDCDPIEISTFFVMTRKGTTAADK